MRGGTPFRITETVEGEGVVRLALAGELDFATHGALQQRLVELSDRRALVHLDLTRLEFVDASGLRVLIGAIRGDSRPPLRIELGDDPAPQVSRLLSVFGCDLS